MNAKWFQSVLLTAHNNYSTTTQNKCTHSMKKERTKDLLILFLKTYWIKWYIFINFEHGTQQNPSSSKILSNGLQNTLKWLLSWFCKKFSNFDIKKLILINFEDLEILVKVFEAFKTKIQPILYVNSVHCKLFDISIDLENLLPIETAFKLELNHFSDMNSLVAVNRKSIGLAISGYKWHRWNWAEMWALLLSICAEIQLLNCWIKTNKPNKSIRIVRIDIARIRYRIIYGIYRRKAIWDIPFRQISLSLYNCNWLTDASSFRPGQ